MDTLTYAFFKGKEHGTWFSKGICFLTRGYVSHVEVIGDDGWSYSSSEQDGGCRRKKIMYSHPERWIFVDVPISDKPTSHVWMGVETMCNLGYDWLGCLSFAWLRYRENPDKWFCSEFCRRIGVLFGSLEKVAKPLNPQQLLNEFENKGYLIYGRENK